MRTGRTIEHEMFNARMIVKPFLMSKLAKAQSGMQMQSRRAMQGQWHAARNAEGVSLH
jgi:hypothetical protein